MGGGGKNAASKEAARARQEEEARQARIRQGTAAINSTFDGGTVGSGALGEDAVYDPNATYYLADGSVWTPPSSMTATPGISVPALTGAPRSTLGDAPGSVLNGVPGMEGAAGTDGGSQERPFGDVLAKFGGGSTANAWKEALKNGLYSGTETRTGFNDDFFNSLSQSYTDYARPQIDKMAGDARKQLTFALARNGTLDSSVRGEKNAEIQRQYDIGLQDITDKGRQFATDARTNVERARADLISMLQATGDAQGASNAALSRAAILSEPPAYSPLGQLFTDFTSGLATQAAFERAEALSGAPRGSMARYNTGLFGPRSGSVRVG